MSHYIVVQSRIRQKLKIHTEDGAESSIYKTFKNCNHSRKIKQKRKHHLSLLIFSEVKVTISTELPEDNDNHNVTVKITIS